MPVKIKEITSGKNKGKVRVSTPGGVKAKATTPAKGKSLKRLLNGIDHGFEPTGKPAKKISKKKC
jgi:hypothetical protein